MKYSRKVRFIGAKKLKGIMDTIMSMMQKIILL